MPRATGALIIYCFVCNSSQKHDCAVLSRTREGTVTGTFYLFSHLCKFGLEISAVSGTAAPKTEALYYPTSTGPYEDGDTAPPRRLGQAGGPRRCGLYEGGQVLWVSQGNG